jgi:hypothetical protein
VTTITGRARALRAIGPALAGSPPPLDAARWEDLAALATDHGLGPALWVHAVRADASGVPPAVARQLSAVYHSNVGRQIKLRADLHQAITTLNAAGIEPVVLKGGALHLQGVLSDVGEREMVDLDLLVEGTDVARATSALVAVGYVPSPRPAFGRPHDLPMHNPTTRTVLELHAELGSPSLVAVLPTETAVGRAIRTSQPDVSYRALDPTDALVHHVLHTQVQDHKHRTFALPLRQLHTLGVMLGAWGPQIDWRAATASFRDHGLDRVLASYLDLGRRFMALDLPPLDRARMPLAARRAVCTASAVVGWPSDLARNLDDAFARDYMRARYPAMARLPLVAVQAVHAAALARGGGRDVLRAATLRRT